MADAKTTQSFEWNAVPGAVSYNVQLLNQSGSPIGGIISQAETSIPVADLCASCSLGTSYQMKVQAVDSYGIGPWSAALPFTLISGLVAPDLPSIV